MHASPHPNADAIVTINPAAPVYGHTDTTPFAFRIEDWNDRVFGRSWMDMNGHPASLACAMRSAMAGLPLDNEVVYGKGPGGLGHLVHVSEIQTATAENTTAA